MRFNALASSMAIVAQLSACASITLEEPILTGRVIVENDGLRAEISARANIRPAASQLRANIPLNEEQRQNLKWVEESAAKHGVDPKTLATVGWLESELRNVRSSKSSATGPMQFVTATARAYGLVDPMDSRANIDAGARLMRDNAAAVRRALGHEPTPAALYMAHMQGIGAYLKLLEGGDSRAQDIVGERQISDNTSGDANASAADFLREWNVKFTRAATLFDLVPSGGSK